MGEKGCNISVMVIHVMNACTRKSKIFRNGTAGFSLARVLLFVGLFSAPRGEATRLHKLLVHFTQTFQVATLRWAVFSPSWQRHQTQQPVCKLCANPVRHALP